MKKTFSWGQLSNTGEVQPPSKINDPKTTFIAAASSMTWQLAVAVLVPIIGGYELDRHLKISPLFIIAGFILAIAGTIMVLKKTLMDINSSQTKPTPEKK